MDNFKKIVEQDCKRISQENNIKWCCLALYIETEFDNGKTEFRIKINSDKSFYIHPINKNGLTFDGKL